MTCECISINSLTYLFEFDTKLVSCKHCLAKLETL